MQPAVECFADGNGTGAVCTPTTQTVYLKNGWVSQVIDANGNANQTFYDSAGRKIKVADAENGTTEYVYDKAGNILTQIVRDSKGAGDRTTAFTYNKLNKQLTEKLEPGDAALERVYAHTYDPMGNKLTRTLPDGTVTRYTYDALKRLTSETYDGASSQNRAYTYTFSGVVSEASESEGRSAYLYDKVGRITVELKKNSSGTEVSRITSAYDKAGNRKTVAYPGGRTLSFGYDRRNLLLSVADGLQLTQYSYDNQGNRTSLTLPNGTVATTVFDAANRVVSIANMKDGVAIHRSEHKMDKMGNRLSTKEIRTGQPDRTLVYSYDRTNYLLSESDGTSSTSFAYDDSGNRISKTVNGAATAYIVDRLNRVLSATTGADTVTYTYDANGNRATKTVGTAVHNYAYDWENRLVSITDGGNTEIFRAAYDYRTRRTICLENGAETRYLYDGGDCVRESNADGSLKTEMTRGTSLGGGIGGVLYTHDGAGAREFFCYNALGSTVATVENSGAVKSGSSYDAWGGVVSSVGASDNDRLFCTKERTVSIGLDNFGKRYYDYELGRFLTRDPAGYPDGANNYVYCSNNPINKIDPLGLMAWYDQVLDHAANFGAGATDSLTMGATSLTRHLTGIGKDGVNPESAAYKAGEAVETGAELASGPVGVVKQGVKKGLKEGVKQIVKEGLKEGAEKTAKEGGEALEKKAVKEAAETAEKEVTKVKGEGKYRGGSHSETSKPAGDGLESHHMPADSTSPVPKDKGPAIQMEPADHAMTSSHGTQGLRGKEYRAEIKEKIESGDMRGAMAQEVKDVRRVARETGEPGKYNEAMREALDYAKKEKIVPGKKK